MQRLTEKQSAGYDLIDMKGLWCDLYCNEQSVYTCKDCAIDKAIQKLAEYEDLEEQGLLIKLPCKVGDTVYSVRTYGRSDTTKKVMRRIEEIPFTVVWLDDIGKIVFLTKEEAEAKLREMEAE